jgi:hypothetical protein
MGSKSGSFLQKTLVWSYDRGTIPYDVLCVLILAFIFFTPRSCFQRRAAAAPVPPPAASAAPAPGAAP